MIKLISILSFLVSASLNAQTITVTWATNPAYPPYDWSTDGKTYQGAVVMLMSQFKISGVQFLPEVLPWRRAQEMARDGSLDLLVNIRDTPEREGWLVFAHNPTFPNPIAVFMRKTDALPSTWTWNDLILLRGGIAAGDQFGSPFDEFLSSHLRVETAPTVVQNFMKLKMKHIDYYVTGLYLGEYWMKTTQQSSYFVTLSPPVSHQDITLAFSKKSPYLDLLPLLDQKLAELQREGSLTEFLRAAELTGSHASGTNKESIKSRF